MGKRRRRKSRTGRESKSVVSSEEVSVLSDEERVPADTYRQDDDGNTACNSAGCSSASCYTSNTKTPPLTRRYAKLDRTMMYESERLSTFINWSVPCLDPKDLAAAGFFSLRDEDAVACNFCHLFARYWMLGETPRGRHETCNPSCPFLRGESAGNIPLSHCRILDKLPVPGQLPPLSGYFTRPSHEPRRYHNRHPSTATGIVDASGEAVDVSALGLPRFFGITSKQYESEETRLISFTNWPTGVKQSPEEMAEAGFVYSGKLSVQLYEDSWWGRWACYIGYIN